MNDFNDRRQREFGRTGERYAQPCMKEIDRFGIASTMVWGDINHYGKTDLKFINGCGRGAVRRNGREMLFCRMLQQTHGMVLQQDNARPHTARATQHFLQDNNIPTLPWPAYPLDLNPIEHLWNHLKQKVHGLNVQNVGELQAALRREWDAVLLEFIRKFVASMRQRCYLYQGWSFAVLMCVR